jgi:DNA-binding NarL/FixJ family response regulator
MRRGASEVKVQGRLAGEIHTNTDVEDLVRQLLDHVYEEATPGDVPQEGVDAREVVLDVRVGTMRYLLTRSNLPTSQPQKNLSPREREIVRLVAKGLPNKAIAEVLDISPWTVATHLRRVFGKLGVSCRAEMVARVLNEGLLGSLE